MPAPIKDITGQTFGHLTVLGLADRTYWKGGVAYWHVTCACGGANITAGNALRRGLIQTCSKTCPHSGLRAPRVDDPAYRTVHNRIERARGRAADHACVDCGGTAAQWSYKETTGYSDDVYAYDPRCVSCHITYDRRAA